MRFTQAHFSSLSRSLWKWGDSSTGTVQKDQAIALGHKIAPQGGFKGRIHRLLQQFRVPLMGEPAVVKWCNPETKVYVVER